MDYTGSQIKKILGPSFSGKAQTQNKYTFILTQPENQAASNEIANSNY